MRQSRDRALGSPVLRDGTRSPSPERCGTTTTSSGPSEARYGPQFSGRAKRRRPRVPIHTRDRTAPLPRRSAATPRPQLHRHRSLHASTVDPRRSGSRQPRTTAATAPLALAPVIPRGVRGRCSRCSHPTASARRPHPYPRPHLHSVITPPATVPPEAPSDRFSPSLLDSLLAE
jgi:hypothetical protein